MEFRKVTIINNKTQSQKVIQASAATTLGELKREMREAGIEYEGMTFFEGHLRAELKDDASILPTNIPYKGQVVNDLTFLLTAPEKKIKSGAMSRAEAYNAIKARGLQNECVKRFGKNFTMCKTQDLIDLLGEGAPVKEEKKEVVKEKATKEVKETKKEEEKPVVTATSEGNVVGALEVLLEDLYISDVMEEDTYNRAMAVLKGKIYKAPEKMSRSEINKMFDFVD
ncbi:hypothetical protein PhiCrAssBcn1_83 [Bacteroides phage PhiCrAssBcn1]|nr:hypothetical protein PhiCrAssBcn4_73 [Bacteroides phage PhiCrAssBcn4]WCF57262.1 hypothetical protein PhiCrAssBcn24_6 [Bacteroides phage PhiCrAssBcn24]WCF57439.1 hypothetical protein PhiCrAssBcn1_83 [Bacteroides phage PhiCrAssBcn1]WCF57468.1 hypothetical protein PhiCrAssBcn2_11 [Bacteroides phage PhiCrAssBcn2]WCF57613.1 hypothetical protein PhiCrAssBcn3_54 [Bacteroides phage PhiCrAssBcn3]WCF57825.1 hypothetical protein PhiCrAssBcn6_72 [Bacteroides phage PhiCrAssBcn6]WCF57866.1 hypothetical 